MKSRNDILTEARAKNPDWGRIRLSKETGIPPSSVQRWLDKQYPKEIHNDNADRIKLASHLAEKLSEREIRAILSDTTTAQKIIPTVELSGSSFKFGIMSDTHIGHKCFREDWLLSAYEFWAREGCEFVYHAGDILEGMSGRDGQIYELSQLGFEDQVEHAAKLFERCPVPIRGITGNHDGWYKQKGNIGVCVGTVLENRCVNFTHIGDDEADEQIGNVKIKLWHGKDGASYALSYRTQKFVEQLSGGHKPHILISGHAHKAIHFDFRNVEIIEAGTLQAQTSFMRGKKLAAHPCVYCVEVWQDNLGLQRIRVEKLKFYE